MHMFNFFKKKERTEFVSPCDGYLKNLSEVNDRVFSSGAMGPGFAVKPSGQTVVSPVSGQILMIAETKHAIGIKADNGDEIIIHMGINSVDLKGKPFSIKISKGDHVKQGQPLVNYDYSILEKNDLDTDIMIVFSNRKDHIIVKDMAINKKEAIVI